MEYIYVGIHQNFQGCHRIFICKTCCKMFDSAKVMVGQKVTQCTPVGNCKKGSTVLLMLKVKSRNLVIVDL